MDSKQKPMSGITFRVMLVIMNIRKKFFNRDVEEEVDLVGIKEGDYILDFGCGPGFNTILASQKVKEQGRVYALDISPQAIEMIKDLAKKKKLNNILTILSDCDTGLEDGSIDIVYLHNTLPYVQDKEDVLNEIYRVLKVGGRLSYISRAVSRSHGDDTISNEQLKKLLASKKRFKLVQEKEGHLIFERVM
ncbi:class I SAM-dependent methyltransferase [bacterium]|nr:class I SAM-dependent methyltransferase [bacterium]